MRRISGVLTCSGAAAVLLFATACSSGPTTDPAQSSAAASTSSAATQPESPAPGNGAPGVLRGADTGEPGLDVLVNVAFAQGTVTPAPGVVEVKAGQKVKVRVTSDQHQDIDVRGLPDKSSDVDPDEPEGVSWIPQQPGDTEVMLRQAKARLVTIHAT